MRNKLILFACLLIGFRKAYAQEFPLAKPSAVQYKWQEQERIMFIHFGVATWLGLEYDETGNFDLSRMNPTQINTDEWCKTALSWGAKQIIFVAKHVGGFCWWQTNTTEYSVRNIPWKNGKGDVLGDLAKSCRKYGLNLGVYIYPGDLHYGAGIGSGGKTQDPALQETYNKVFRQQLTEVLKNYGNMLEVWFDGSCVIDVSDILEKYARNAVIFQSTHATIRWPGTESGKLAYPAWNSLKSSVLKTGIATQYDDDPDGDAWAPLEADVTLYNHNWFWNPTNGQKRRPVAELMDIYYKSAGYGGILLLNSTPDTTGRIPIADRERYKAFGDEINRRFGHPLTASKTVETNETILKFTKPTSVNHTILEEDYREGHRIRDYIIEGKVGTKWQLLAQGSSVGRKKIDAFPTITLSEIKLTIKRSVNPPLVRSFSAYGVKNYTHHYEPTETKEWAVCGGWNTNTFKNGRDTIDLDLSRFIDKPGQYEFKFIADVAVTGASIDSAVINFERQNTMQEYLIRKDENTFYINHTSQVTPNSASILTLFMQSDNKVFQNRGVFKIRKRGN
ncbi:alpha-L-fucosidase [Flavihumibacter profundi]|uniref:alpha-L-fucosidase n=1 Tax=Flavihumibacter profundi TaxID=2716883 RepID=UPI001CC3FDEF|nr:alpha-L-fucosidase [Flavihumibacter profundi]MBZ5858782.1 alpha-L-fucosidase [Flavihumibacter profundi]